MARGKKFGEIRNRETGEVLIQFIAPRAENDPLSICLRMLTHQLHKRDTEEHYGGGIFGGAFGYGVDFENDVFEMHPDWQGDCTCGATEPIHSDACQARFIKWRDARNEYAIEPSTEEEREAEIQDSIKRGFPERSARLMACARPWSFERSLTYEKEHPAPDCICEARNWVERDTHDSSCRLEQHCFTFKPSGFVMDWYKYIGRDNEIRNEGEPISLADMFGACLVSIGAPSLEECLAEWAKAEDEEAERFKRSTELFFGSESATNSDAVDPNDGNR